MSVFIPDTKLHLSSFLGADGEQNATGNRVVGVGVGGTDQVDAVMECRGMAITHKTTVTSVVLVTVTSVVLVTVTSVELVTVTSVEMAVGRRNVTVELAVVTSVELITKT